MKARAMPYTSTKIFGHMTGSGWGLPVSKSNRLAWVLRLEPIRLWPRFVGISIAGNNSGWVDGVRN